LDKGRAMRLALKFLFLPRCGPWPLADVKAERPSDGSAQENKQNIAYHYDVSNAFYALFLDSEMLYSCGYATDWDNDLERMQQDKLELICRKLRLKPGDRLLDIGCGWGALVCYAAQHYGVTATGVSLSEEQVALAQAKVKRLGLEDRVTIELRNYSTVEGTFDKVVSVGFQEHVGLDNMATYYETVRRVLTKDGLFLNHAITRPAKRTDKIFKRKRPEFALLTKYIFPGGELDNIGTTIKHLEQHGFDIADVEGLREHYQRTCRHWHDRLLARYDEAVTEVGEAKTRLWLIYLAGCSIAFERGTVSIHQTLSTRRKRGPSGLPPTRADLYR
jgi:cyclopropane-fatty-acyl-phospholipid synthase